MGIDMDILSDEYSSKVANDAFKLFLGDNKISRIIDLHECKEDVTLYVLACYYDVVEGVDMWYSDDVKKDNPRYLII
jgi:hypothetical protein